MAVLPFTLATDADGSVGLNQRLTRGGVVTAWALAGLAGQYWLAPRDSQRRYISFGVAPGVAACLVTPGDDNAPGGFWITPGTDPVEFGGKSHLPLVQSEWWVTTFAAVEIHTVIVRDT